jgi:DNA-binding helix-hairpin-helix protein with protein kinase domain
MSSLARGQLLRGVASNITCRVASLIGEGGQGEVYAVDLNGQPFALKWYNDLVLRVDRGLRNRLQMLVDLGAPSAKFLWPFELLTLPDRSRLGYVMRLRRDGLQSVHDLLSGRIQPGFRALATLCCLLTDALLALHAKGLAYQDLNPGNVFFDPQTGDIEICDNDNVDVSGAPSVMGGVWEFQAPEVVLRQAGPSRDTDLHSLAVMLFRILHLGHPLVGRRELQFSNLANEAVQRRLYGSEARFVYDPADDSNRPCAELHGPVIAHWQLYPQFVRDLFTRAFTEGLYDPSHGRVQETEWRRAMNQLRDSVITCASCGAESFYDARRLSARQSAFACWACGSNLASAPPRIGIRRQGARPGEQPPYVVVLEPGARLFPHHTGAGEYEFNQAVAEVTAEPLALRNLSRCAWTGVREGERIEIGQGDAVALSPGLRLRFDRTEGEVKV